MQAPDQQKTLEIAVGIAREAGALLLDGFGREKRIEKKSSALDWVTQYDKASETLIVERLRQAFPDHALVGEEGTDTGGQGDYRWYIDPLDGTVNYAHGYPMFCVSMGLYHGDDPVLGVIYDPLRQECFTAIAGQGAYLDRPQGSRRLQVSRQTELVAALVMTGFPYDVHTSPENNLNYMSAFVRSAHGIRRSGSAALDAAYVAAGRLDGYWELKVYCWDMSAAVLIVQEAGGRVTFLDGRPFRLERRFDVLISNGHLHEQMQAVVNSAGATSSSSDI
ncbi:MAG TPA: inositol monophosphatase family protein [Promineifilum sp.]|nr:inositol monophosphatase family protein [Promineifilum sp.]HRO23257.1 inositol monophosphatase family protein [Promineifilum sp.]HRO89838.1 inositol monophosphatase family protein [Promineifilum sp.]HRQ14052.1 inositol monophosphatase family protein [Promineifilum sp.]